MQADSRGRDLWLHSSNVANNPFYQSHGYEIIEEVKVGEDNPTWDREPVVVAIVRPFSSY